MIEPAALGKPTIVGPMTQNFKDVVKIFAKGGAIVQVNDAQGLYSALRKLLTDPQKATAIGNAAKRTVESHQGATSRNIEAISNFLVR